jgi:hypothetical protein
VISSNDCGFEEAIKRSKSLHRSDDRSATKWLLLAAFSLLDEEVEIEVISQGMRDSRLTLGSKPLDCRGSRVGVVATIRWLRRWETKII